MWKNQWYSQPINGTIRYYVSWVFRFFQFSSILANAHYLSTSNVFLAWIGWKMIRKHNNHVNTMLLITVWIVTLFASGKYCTYDIVPYVATAIILFMRDCGCVIDCDCWLVVMFVVMVREGACQVPKRAIEIRRLF